MVETVQYPLTRALAPPLSVVLTPLKLGHWCATLLDVGIKLVAVSLAWFLQVRAHTRVHQIRLHRAACSTCACTRSMRTCMPMHPKYAHVNVRNLTVSVLARCCYR